MLLMGRGNPENYNVSLPGNSPISLTARLSQEFCKHSCGFVSPALSVWLQYVALYLTA